ncbi:hypothetical protein [Haliangium sp.]|uniref:hypothetical protein n=1 Tax=Haliangium sp. TaxID=2663208 RepID=UPI003D0EC63C
MSYKHLMAATVAVALATSGLLWAQPGLSPAAPEPTPPPSSPTEADSVAADPGELAPQDMVMAADRLIGEIGDARGAVVEVQSAAREDKDVLRSNCVDDKLAQLDQLLEIATAARADLAAMVAAGDREGRLHHYGLITVSQERAVLVQAEADACIGEEMRFEGDTDIDVTDPGLDDPTKYAPFKLADSPLLDDAVLDPTQAPWDDGYRGDQPVDIPIERPGYATPYR